MLYCFFFENYYYHFFFFLFVYILMRNCYFIFRRSLIVFLSLDLFLYFYLYNTKTQKTGVRLAFKSATRGEMEVLTFLSSYFNTNLVLISKTKKNTKRNVYVLTISILFTIQYTFLFQYFHEFSSF